MALPSIQSLEDGASWSTTVAPFVDQLYMLPRQVLAAGFDVDAQLKLYTATNPAISGFAISVFLGAVFLVVSEINKNYSQVDRMWSLLPMLYNAHYAYWARLAGVPTQKLDVAFAVSLIWSVCVPTRGRLQILLPPGAISAATSSLTLVIRSA